jgi:hypothetical protein
MYVTVAQLVIAFLGCNAVFEFLRYLIERRDQKKESPERMMLRALGEEKLGKMLRNWLHSDVRLADDWRIIENLYHGYKALGGNGEIKKLFEEASDLKTTE